jgi:hypothetical protein
MPRVNTSGASAAQSGPRNHAKPTRTISNPKRDSGRRRQAYRPVPTKLHPTTGPKTAHMVGSGRCSLPRTSSTSPTPQSRAAAAMASVRRAVMSPS